MKLQKQTIEGSLSVTLPKQVVVGYGWQQGDEIGFKIEKPGTITLFKK
jgi:hypothetical protein